MIVDDHRFKAVPGSRHGKLMYLDFSGRVPLVLLVPLDSSMLERFVLVIFVQRIT